MPRRRSEPMNRDIAAERSPDRPHGKGTRDRRRPGLRSIAAPAPVAACILAASLAAALVASACAPAKKAADVKAKTVVATYAVLGALVGDLAGGEIRVSVMIPSGFDVHEWEPSAKEMELLSKADLVVENGLGLEGGMARALAVARRAGARFFTASDHVAERKVREGEGIPSGDPDQAAGAVDPHIWTDPQAMRPVVRALAEELKRDFGVDLGSRAADLERRLGDLDAEIRAEVASLPPEARKLVTGHESLGYFAQRYGFKLVGAVIPGFSTEAEGSAEDFAALKKVISSNGVKVVFTEIGTPERTVAALAREAKVRAVPLATHSLPADGSYITYERELAKTVVDALR
jgi:zinc/manganese transport system substrate-binding protein